MPCVEYLTGSILLILTLSKSSPHLTLSQRYIPLSHIRVCNVCPFPDCTSGYSSNWGNEHSNHGATYPGVIAEHTTVGSSDAQKKASCQQQCIAGGGAAAFNYGLADSGCRCYSASQRLAITLTGSGWEMCAATGSPPPAYLSILSSLACSNACSPVHFDCDPPPCLRSIGKRAVLSCLRTTR